MKKLYLLSLFLGLLLLSNIINAQVAINNDNSNPDPSAMLDVKSTDKGMLVPRMTTAQRTTISSPANGLLVFDSTTGSFWFYNSGAWQDLTGQNPNPWIPSGNNIPIQREMLASAMLHLPHR